jgi:hypothetical protein
MPPVLSATVIAEDGTLIVGRGVRHKKRGTTYVEIGRGTLHNSSWPLNEGTPMVIYMNPDSGHYWVRSEGEFATRFEPAAGAST